MTFRVIRIAAALFAAFLMSGASQAQAPKKDHRLIIQVNESDPGKMTMALNNMANVYEYYRKKNEPVQVELVAYGPGLHLFRADSSPVRTRLDALKLEHDGITFTACGNTIVNMEKAEGKPIALLPDVGVVEAGVTRIMELQEQGWSYLRP